MINSGIGCGRRIRLLGTLATPHAWLGFVCGASVRDVQKIVSLGTPLCDEHQAGKQRCTKSVKSGIHDLRF